MKIIGEAGDGYIAVVSHTELEKATDKYYGNLKRLRVGDVFDLSQAYDFHTAIAGLCNQMVSSMSRFEQTKDTLLRFGVLVGQSHPEAKQV
jgi:hypothetical protein